MKLPGHNESYNPPDEYLMSEVVFYKFPLFFSGLILNSIYYRRKRKKNGRMLTQMIGNNHSFLKNMIVFVMSNSIKDSSLSDLKDN